MKLTRKCILCKRPINLVTEFPDIICPPSPSKMQFAHISCYKAKLMGQRRGALTSGQADELISSLAPATRACISQVLSPKPASARPSPVRGVSTNPRRQLTDWLLKAYDVSSIPVRFYQKLAAVYDGSYTGLAQPVPAEHLLDMWQQKKQYLDKVAAQNAQKGKRMDVAQRLNYDLAILLVRYKDYLAWKQKQENAAQQSSPPEEKVKYQNLSRACNSGAKASPVSIEDILDEI